MRWERSVSAAPAGLSQSDQIGRRVGGGVSPVTSWGIYENNNNAELAIIAVSSSLGESQRQARINTTTTKKKKKDIARRHDKQIPQMAAQQEPTVLDVLLSVWFVCEADAVGAKPRCLDSRTGTR